MLDSEQRFYLARHLLNSVEGLEDRILTDDKTKIRDEAKDLLEKEKTSTEAKIMGLAALDIFDQSGGTFLGEAIRTLSPENFRRLANAITALRP